MDLYSALQQCGGVASHRRLRGLGVTGYQIWAGVVQGRVEKVQRGVYAVVEADPTMLALVRSGGIVSCAAAARQHGLPLLAPWPPHITVARNRAYTQFPGGRVHRRDLAAHEHDGLCTSLLRTVLDCGRELPLREAVVVIDGALGRGLDAPAVAAAARAASGPGAGALRHAVGLADDRAESPLESLLRLLAAPLGELGLQVWFAGVGRVDMVLDGWLVLEADGFEHHSRRQEYRADRRRANALAEQGCALLRFSYEDLVFRPDYVRATIQAALGSRRVA